MPMPTFPQIDPPLTREGSINGIISSIAAEELSLSHILNTQGEKLQYVLGTLPGLEKAADLEEVMKVNKSVQDTMSDVMEQQMLLTAKLSAAMKAPVYPGPTGPTGPAGPTGPTGPNVTATNAYAASTKGAAFTVLMSGTNVALPDAQTLSPDITVNGANDTFTVAEAGRYRVSYNINSVTPLTLGARLMVDGTEIEASNVMPQTAPLSRLSNDFLVDLAAGAKVSLQVYGYAGLVTLLPNSIGASLSMVRLS